MAEVKQPGRGLDWLKLRDFLVGQDSGRDVFEMLVSRAG
jgi:hypothetical protein